MIWLQNAMFDCFQVWVMRTERRGTQDTSLRCWRRRPGLSTRRQIQSIRLSLTAAPDTPTRTTCQHAATAYTRLTRRAALR